VRKADEELVWQAIAGETEAFTALVDRYRCLAYGVALHYLHHVEDAKDIAQEAFIQAYLHLPELRDGACFSSWLRRLTLNLCADFLRRRGMRLLSLEGLPETTENRRQMGQSLPMRPYTEMPVERVTDRLMVRQALARLSEKTRLTVTLCYLGGYSHAEIARFLEIPVNTVRSRLQIAKRQLREEMTMLNDALSADKPDMQFTRKVVEEALRRGQEAMAAYRKGEAFAHYNEALAALENWTPDREQRQFRMDALWSRGVITEQMQRGHVDALVDLENALAIAVELGDKRSQADKRCALADAYYNSNNQALAPKYVENYRQALALYEEVGDGARQGDCLMALGMGTLWGDVPEGRKTIEEALARFEAASAYARSAQACAVLDLLKEVGEARFPRLNGFMAGSDILGIQGGAIRHRSNSVVVSYSWKDGPEGEGELPLKVQDVFAQLARMGTFLPENVAVGARWASSVESASLQPLTVLTTIQSFSERVVVPAGEFTSCLLTEQVTTESDQPDDAPEARKQVNQREYCGVRCAWYAPGVGLIQLQVRRDDGVEALIQLQHYEVTMESAGYLPIAVGNTWAYGWANTPPGYIAKEVYRITAFTGEAAYLEHYGFVDQPALPEP